MILPDVNVLIYAFRPDLPQFSLCRPWLETVIAQDLPFGISPLTLSALVRITTNPRAFVEATKPSEAFAFCDALLGHPRCEQVVPGAQHWSVFRRLCLQTETRGPGITDAWLAALAIEHGCTFITFDRDFGRFPGLRWAIPEIPG
jgi:uncharacterized protein